MSAADWITRLLHHPASTLVAVVLVVLLLRLLLAAARRSGRARRLDVPPAAWSGYAMWFFSGVLLTNFLAHFPHGISGEPFPAPFGFALGSGFPERLANVLWGFLNLVLAYGLFKRGEVATLGTRGASVFLTGILVMGIVLSFVFSR